MDTLSFKSQIRCQYDGTYERLRAVNGKSGVGKCVECENYKRRIASGLIVGIDNRTDDMKAHPEKYLPKRTPIGNQHKWSDEELEQHSEAIRRGLKRRKNAT